MVQLVDAEAPPVMARRVAVMLAVRRFMLMAPIVALCIQSATFALVAAAYLDDLGVPMRVAVPGIFLGSLALAMLAAWVWVAVWRMNEADREAVRSLDPYQKNRLTERDARLLALAVKAMRRDPGALDELEAAAKRGRL